MKQTTNSVLLIRPETLAANPETFASNQFQSESSNQNPQNILSEFDHVVETFRNAGITVHVIQDSPEPKTPDCHFPNNWFSTHEESLLVLYPMLNPSRQTEAKPEPLNFLQSRYEETLDFRHLPPLEGTGSFVLDRVNRVAFACESPRTTYETAHIWAREMDYELVWLQAKDGQGQAIYHTNVLMSCGTDFLLASQDAMSKEDWQKILDHSFGKEVIPIAMNQLLNYAGNCLELETPNGKNILAISTTGWESLSQDQQQKIEEMLTPVIIPIPTIEALGGGSIRCMIAELF